MDGSQIDSGNSILLISDESGFVVFVAEFS